MGYYTKNLKIFWVILPKHQAIGHFCPHKLNVIKYKTKIRPTKYLLIVLFSCVFFYTAAINYNMINTVLSYAIAIIITILLIVVFSVKKRGIIKIIINLSAGLCALIILVLFNVYPFTLNPLTAFLIGVLGAPGLIVIFVILRFL